MRILKPFNMDEAIAVMAGSLTSHQLLTKWLELPRARQEQLIHKAFEEGVLTHKRGDDEKLH
jgi:hypothetical protein